MGKGKIPEGYCITHINGDIFNDKIENLKMIKMNEVNVRRNPERTYKIIFNLFYEEFSDSDIEEEYTKTLEKYKDFETPGEKYQ